MNSMHSVFIEADDILKEYVKNNDKFKKRYETLMVEMDEFLEATGYTENARVDGLVLGYLLVDYFEDIHRLKLFHNVDHINSIRIVSYISYWIAYRKPIQITNSKDKQLVYINERFVLWFILNFLSSKTDEHIVERENAGLKSFSDALLYFLKYRFTSANSLELILTSFFAGEIYQSREIDLSNRLTRYDISD